MVITMRLFRFPVRMSAFSVFLCGLVLYLEKISRDQFYLVAEVDAQTEQAAKAHNIVQEIMHALVPPSVLKRLVSGEKIADGGDVSVMFADVAGFTAWCSNRTAANVVESLNRLYRMVDTAKYELFEAVVKVKTIGDAYWAMCGLPDHCDTHALTVVRFAYWMRTAVNHQGLFNVRYGIHSGQVVCGVVGLQNFSYEPFGATNELAEVVEAACPIGSLLVTEATVQTLKRQSPHCGIVLEAGPEIDYHDGKVPTHDVVNLPIDDDVTTNHEESDDNTVGTTRRLITVGSTDLSSPVGVGAGGGGGQNCVSPTSNESSSTTLLNPAGSRRSNESSRAVVGNRNSNQTDNDSIRSPVDVDNQRDKDESNPDDAASFTDAGSNAGEDDERFVSIGGRVGGECVSSTASESKNITIGMQMLIGDHTSSEKTAKQEEHVKRIAETFERKHKNILLDYKQEETEKSFGEYCTLKFRMTSYGGNVLIFVMMLSVYCLSFAEGRSHPIVSHVLRATSLAIPFIFMVFPILPVSLNFASLYIGYLLVLVGTYYMEYGVASNEIIYLMVFYSTAALCRGVPMYSWIVVVVLNIALIVLPMMVVNQITIHLRVHHLYHPITNIASWLVAQRRLEMSARAHFEAQTLAVESRALAIQQYKVLSEVLEKVVPHFIIPTLRNWFQSGHHGYPSRNYRHLGVLFLRVPPLQEADVLKHPGRLIKLVSATVSKIDETMRHFPEIVKVKTVGDIALIISGVISVPKKTEDPGSFAIDVPKKLMFPHYDLGQLAIHLAAAVASAGEGMHAHIGIHSGPVTCGIIGTDRPIFDAFGDTVNVAARIAAISKDVHDDVLERNAGDGGVAVSAVLDGITPRTESGTFGSVNSSSGLVSVVSSSSNVHRKVAMPIFVSTAFVDMYESEEINREQKMISRQTTGGGAGGGGGGLVSVSASDHHFVPTTSPGVPFATSSATSLPAPPRTAGTGGMMGTTASKTNTHHSTDSVLPHNPLAPKKPSSVGGSSTTGVDDGAASATSSSSTARTPAPIQVIVSESAEEMQELLGWTMSPSSSGVVPSGGGGGAGKGVLATPQQNRVAATPRHTLPPLPTVPVSFGREVPLTAKGKVSAVVVRRIWKATS